MFNIIHMVMWRLIRILETNNSSNLKRQFYTLKQWLTTTMTLFFSLVGFMSNWNPMDMSFAMTMTNFGQTLTME